MADKLDKFKTEICREFSKTIFYLTQHPELSAAEVKQEIGALRLAIDKVFDNNKQETRYEQRYFMADKRI